MNRIVLYSAQVNYGLFYNWNVYTLEGYIRIKLWDIFKNNNIEDIVCEIEHIRR